MASGHPTIDLDLESVRQQLSCAGTRSLSIRRPRVPEDQALSQALRGVGSVALEFEEPYQRLEERLRRGLCGLGLDPRLRHAISGRSMYWVRWFVGLTGENRPWVSLLYEPEGSLAAARPANPVITMTIPVLGMTAGALDVVIDKRIPPRLAPAVEGDVVLTVATEKPPWFLRREAGASPDTPAVPPEVVRKDVVLINMPFGLIHQPSIGLSLLKGCLRDIDVEILYFSLEFARRIGAPFYEWISEGNPTQTALLGEWIFSDALFGRNHSDVQKYKSEFLRSVPEVHVEELLRTRERVDAFLDDCVLDVVRRRPRVVGFTSVFQQHVPALALAKRLRQAVPSITIVFGGANCDGPMGAELVRQFEFVDAAVSGEGEAIFPAMVDAILGGEGMPSMPNVHTRPSGNGEPVVNESAVTEPIRDLDTLPYPDFDDFFRQWRQFPFLEDEPRQLPFETSRGCWWGEKHHCTFCGLNGSTMRFRSKSSERALDELAHLADRYSTLRFNVVDNILDMDYFHGFIPELARRDLGVRLFYETKANLKKDQVRMLADAGIVCIQAGIESLSDDVLSLMRKGVTALQNIQLLKWCREYKVGVSWNLIWGFPGETEQDYVNMIELLPLLSHLPPPDGCGPIRLDRFSPNFERSDASGFRDVRPCAAYSHVYPLSERSLSRMAFYFDYDYVDRRHPKEHAEGLEAALSDWKGAYPRSRLISVDKVTALLVFDRRPCSKRSVTILTGLERRLYLACDRVRSLQFLSRLLSDERRQVSECELESLLHPMLESGLMVRIGERVLSLAVDLAPPDPV